MRHAALLLCLAIIGCSGGVAPTTPPKAATTHADDPWPECKQIREYFAENLGEPQSFEVVKWESKTKRSPLPQYTERESSRDFQTTYEVRFKFRAKNKFGALEVKEGMFIFLDGRLKAPNIYDQS